MGRKVENHRAPSGRKKRQHPIAPELRIIPLPLEAEVQPGNSLPKLLVEALKQQKERLRKGDILVIKHKIVSKAEGRVVRLAEVEPSAQARDLAAQTHQLPALLAACDFLLSPKLFPLF